MLTVVGGIGSVAGALMGGILAGTAFQALTSTFSNLSTDAGGGGFWSVMANLSLVAPALIGISLGRNPSGAVPDIVARYKPLWQAKGVLLLGVMAEIVAYLLVLTKVMGNWWLVLATALIAIALPAVGRLVQPEAFKNPAKAQPPGTDRRRCRPPAEPLRRCGRCPFLRSRRCASPSGGPGPERRVADRGRGGGDRPDRAERGRQDHVVQCRQRLAGPQVRAGVDRRSGRDEGRTGAAGPGGGWPAPTSGWSSSPP